MIHLPVLQSLHIEAHSLKAPRHSLPNWREFIIEDRHRLLFESGESSRFIAMVAADICSFTTRLIYNSVSSGSNFYNGRPSQWADTLSLSFRRKVSTALPVTHCGVALLSFEDASYVLAIRLRSIRLYGTNYNSASPFPSAQDVIAWQERIRRSSSLRTIRFRWSLAISITYFHFSTNSRIPPIWLDYELEISMNGGTY